MTIREHLHGFKICRYRMGNDFRVELVTQDDHIFELVRHWICCAESRAYQMRASRRKLKRDR